MPRFRSARRPFLLGCAGSAAYFAVLIHFRGFGWDGDSIINAAQLYRLFIPELYESYLCGTHPKFLMMVLFGSVYKLTGTFHVTTIVSVILNSVMIGLMCKWVKERGGIWLISLLGFVLSLSWSVLVIDVDNPALSIPFNFIGLYLYFHASQRRLGILCLAISSLFRPGAELVLFVIILWEVYQRNFKIKLHCVVLGILLLSSYFGVYLGHPSKLAVLQCLITPYVAVAPFSYQAVEAYFRTVRVVFTTTPYFPVFLILALIGTGRLLYGRNLALASILAPVSSLFVLMGALNFGVIVNFRYDKLMEFSLLVPLLAGFAIPQWLATVKWKFPANLRSAAGILAFGMVFLLATDSAVSYGKRYRGSYQTHTNGTGTHRWINLRGVEGIIKQKVSNATDLAALVDVENEVFFFLDVGPILSRIDIFKGAQNIVNYPLDNYDIIVINADKLADMPKSALQSLQCFQKIPLSSGRVLFLEPKPSCLR